MTGEFPPRGFFLITCTSFSVFFSAIFQCTSVKSYNRTRVLFPSRRVLFSSYSSYK
nr:MAG TPA: hypothetical protein [Caudoviricetes sp.]DAY97139.1 MAG TPA: hypothetical protein [Caudoviricetes sp.]